MNNNYNGQIPTQPYYSQPVVPEEYKPISAWGYFGYQILFAIPLIGFILLIVFSLSDSNINLRNYARSYWCALILIFVILFLILGFFIYEWKFAEKSIFDKGDKYEEYDSNYSSEEKSNISQSEDKKSNIQSNSNEIVSNSNIDSNSNTSGEKIKVTSLKLNSNNISINVNEEMNIGVTIYPGNATNKNVKYKSNDSSIVTIDSNGKIKGIKKGTTYITVTSEDGGLNATAKVTVNEVTSTTPTLTLNSSNFNLEVSESKTITATVTNVSNKTITWSSSNTDVASVSNGKVTCNKLGNSTITAKNGNLSKSITVTCKNLIRFSTNNLVLYKSISNGAYANVTLEGKSTDSINIYSSEAMSKITFSSTIAGYSKFEISNLSCSSQGCGHDINNPLGYILVESKNNTTGFYTLTAKTSDGSTKTINIAIHEYKIINKITCNCNGSSACGKISVSYDGSNVSFTKVFLKKASGSVNGIEYIDQEYTDSSNAATAGNTIVEAYVVRGGKNYYATYERTGGTDGNGNCS